MFDLNILSRYQYQFGGRTNKLMMYNDWISDEFELMEICSKCKWHISCAQLCHHYMLALYSWHETDFNLICKRTLFVRERHGKMYKWILVVVLESKKFSLSHPSHFVMYICPQFLQEMLDLRFNMREQCARVDTRHYSPISTDQSFYACESKYKRKKIIYNYNVISHKHDGTRQFTIYTVMSSNH